MEEDGGESVGSGAADMPAMGVGIGVGVGASDDSIEVSSTSHADVSAVSLYRGTFNIDDAASASASSTTSAASTASASTSVKDVSTPATKGKSTNADNKPSPTSVDMFDMFLAETAVEAEEVQEEADDDDDGGGLDLSPARVARDLAQHGLNIRKLEHSAEYADDLKLMERGVRRVENLRQLQEECVSFATAATALGSDPDTTGAPASRLVAIIRQKECLLIRLAARLSGVTRKLAKKDRDVQKLKAALDAMRDRVKSSTKSDHKHIEGIAVLAGRLREMEMELSDKDALVTRLFEELATSKREYEAVIVDLRETHEDELQKYVQRNSNLTYAIQEVGNSPSDDSVTDYNSLHPSVEVKETDLSDEIECVFVPRSASSVQSQSLLMADSFATAEQEQSLRTAGSFATAAQSLLRSTATSEKGDTLSLKFEIDELKDHIAQMEEDVTSKDRELSGISRVLFPDEDSDEEDHESVQVIERATRLVDDLQTEKSTSEAVQRDLDLARQELARLQDSLQKAEEQLVEKLDEGLSRLKDLELELGEKDVAIAALTDELEQSQERADTDISVLKQSAADESLRHQDEMDAVKSEMDARISELEAKHAKVCEELEARIAQHDENIAKICASNGTLVKREALESQYQEIEAPVAKETVDHQTDYSLLSLQSEKSRLERELRSVQVKAKADIAALQSAKNQERSEFEARLQELEKSLSGLKEDKKVATQGLEATISALLRHKSALSEEIERRKKMLQDGEDIAESSQKKAEDEIRSLTESTKALEERYRALKGENTSVSVDIQAGVQGEQLLSHQNIIAELEQRIEALLAEKAASEQTHLATIATLKSNSAKSLGESAADSADAAAKLDDVQSTSAKLEKEVVSLRLENERLGSKAKDILTSKDRKIAEAWKLVEDKRVVIINLESEKKTMKLKIRDLERDLKMNKARSQGKLLALQTEVEKLRSSLADSKRELTSMETEKQNEIVSLREFYESKIIEFEEDKKKLSSQLYDLHVSIVGTVKAVVPGSVTSSSTSSPEDNSDDRLAALRAQKDLTIKEVRMEMQAALDLKEQELEALKHQNSVGAERIKALELLLEMKEGELVDVKRALAEKSFFLEESVAYDDTLSDDETLIASPTRTTKEGNVEEGISAAAPLVSRDADAVREVSPAYRVMLMFGKTLVYLFIRLPIKIAALGLILFLSCLAMVWVGAALVVAWSFLADDNGAAKIGAGISYGGFVNGIINI